jgi:PAS domain S-box-containing protein
MENNLFNLDFTRWEVILLSIVPATINFGILTYVLLVFQKTKTNIFFSIFVFLLGMWQITEGFMRLSLNINTVADWLRISEIFLIFVIPTGIFFVLRFAKWEKKAPVNLISLVFLFPAVFFFILVQGRYDSFTIFKSPTIYWLANPNPTFFTLLLLLWMSTGALLMLVLLWAFFLKNRKNALRRKQSLLLASGITIPVISGIVGELIFPLFLEYNNVPVTVPLMTVFSITSLIAIKKYKILDFSPKHHWDQIILNEGLLVIDNNDAIMYANKTFCRLTGYKLDEIEGKISYSLFFNSTDHEKIKHIIDERKNKISSQYEIEIVTKTGEKKWLLVNGSPYIGSNGEVIGSIGVLTDITLIKNAEKELRTNELRLRNAQKVAHVGSWEMNFASNQSIWSEEACRIYGIPPEERVHSFEEWLSFIHPEDLSSVKKVIEKSQISSSNSSFKHRIICKDGTIKHISSASEFEFNDLGYPVGLIGICHDITDLITAKEAFIESEDRMTMFINDSLLCIYFIDPDTKKISFSNSAFAQLLDYSPEEMKSLQIYDIIDHPKNDVDAIIEEVIRAGKINNGESKWRKKNGQIIHVLLSSFYVNRNGKKTVIVAAQDVSERKKAEEALKVTNQELETFIYRASHDLRGPLASIIGLANLSKMEITDELALKYLDMIGTGTEKLDYTLTELVKAMEIRNIKDFNNEIDFETLLKEALLKFEFFPGYSRLKIKTDVSIKKPFVTNRIILETILQNLIENSIKYQNYNSTESFLKIRVSDHKDGITIVVEDNGIGIEKSIQSRIFEMYFRGSSELKGSGLGLYLVKKGIEKLNGRIDLNSNKGEGAIFIINLFSKNSYLSNGKILLN